MSPHMESFNGGKCMSAIMGAAAAGGYTPPPLSESQVKLIDGSETPSNGVSRGGAEAAAAAARVEEEKDARAAKKCCGCC